MYVKSVGGFYHLIWHNRAYPKWKEQSITPGPQLQEQAIYSIPISSKYVTWNDAFINPIPFDVKQFEQTLKNNKGNAPWKSNKNNNHKRDNDDDKDDTDNDTITTTRQQRKTKSTRTTATTRSTSSKNKNKTAKSSKSKKSSKPKQKQYKKTSKTRPKIRKSRQFNHSSSSDDDDDDEEDPNSMYFDCIKPVKTDRYTKIIARPGLRNRYISA